MVWECGGCEMCFDEGVGRRNCGKILVDRGDMCVGEGFRVRVWSETKVRVLRFAVGEVRV